MSSRNYEGPCRCCGETVLPFIGGSIPEYQLCDDCGKGKCSDCITEVRKLWKPLRHLTFKLQ